MQVCSFFVNYEYILLPLIAGYTVRNIALKHFLVNESNQVKLIDLSEACPFATAQSNPSVGVEGNV